MGFNRGPVKSEIQDDQAAVCNRESSVPFERTCRELKRKRVKASRPETCVPLFDAIVIDWQLRTKESCASLLECVGSAWRISESILIGTCPTLKIRTHATQGARSEMPHFSFFLPLSRRCLLVSIRSYILGRVRSSIRSITEEAWTVRRDVRAPIPDSRRG